MCLHEIYLTYIVKRATTYYNNYAFPAKLFPCTASSAALDIFQSCYCDVRVKAYKEVYDILAPRHIGGVTCVFSSFCQYAVSFDVNGSYNAAMHNLIPTTPVYNKQQKSFVNKFDCVNIFYSSREAKEKFFSYEGMDESGKVK